MNQIDVAVDGIDGRRQLGLTSGTIGSGKEQTRSLSRHDFFIGMLSGIDTHNLESASAVTPVCPLYNTQSYFHNQPPISPDSLYRDWLRRIEVKHSRRWECRILAVFAQPGTG